MKLAIVLVHNKTDSGNEAQIDAILPLVEKITESNTRFDDNGNPAGTYETYYYKLNALLIPHEVRFFQVFPFGVTLPPNKDLLDSYKVYYGIGDEDKKGKHPRFFNWGLKRSTDYGAEVTLYLEDLDKLSMNDLPFQLTELLDPDSTTELIETSGGKLATLKLLKEVGQLPERNDFNTAFANLRSEMAQKGLSHG